MNKLELIEVITELVQMVAGHEQKIKKLETKLKKHITNTDHAHEA